MADELTQSGFDETIKKLSADVEAAGDGVERSVEDQSEVLERIISRSVKAIMTGLTNSTKLVEQIAVTQQTVQEEEVQQDKQSIFLLTNMGDALRGLLTLGTKGTLAGTERRREEKRTSDALIGTLTEMGDGIKSIQSGLIDFLKLVTNPLALIGAIVGIAIGTVSGFFAFFARALNLPLILQAILKPIRSLLDPKSRAGKAITGIAKRIGRAIDSFVRVWGRVSGFILKQLPFIQKIINFIRPFATFGRALGSLLGKLALPLTIAISIVKAVLGFRDELKKGGDLIDATFRAIGDILDFLTFGVLNADQLKKFIGEPIRNFIAGIKELFTEGFSIATMNKIMEPLIQFILATPNIMIQAIGKITAFIAEKLGFENFSKKLTAFLADFDVFTFVNDMMQSLSDFFVSLPEKLAQLPEIFTAFAASFVTLVKAVFLKFINNPLGTVKEIGEIIVDMFTKITNTLFDFILSALPDFLLPKELQAAKAARKVEKEGLERLSAIQAELGLASLKEAGEELKRRQDLKQVQKLLDTNAQAVGAAGSQQDKAALDALIEKRKALFQQAKDLEALTPATLDELAVARRTASAIELAAQMAANAGLRDKANRAAPPIIPIPAPPIITGGQGTPMVIPVPLAMRNSENTLRRVMSKDFTGTQG